MLSEGREPLIWWGQLYAKYLSETLINKYWCEVDLFTRKFIWDDKKSYTKNEVLQGWKRKVFRVWPMTSFFSILWRLWWLFKVTIFLYKKAKKEKYDIIHAHALSPWLPARIVWKLCKIPVVYTVHGTMQMDANRKGMLYWGEKFFVTKIRYDLEISVSSRILKYKNVNKNIKVIYPWLYTKKFEPTHQIKKHPGRQFLFVGRLDRQKWLEYLIEALKIIGTETLKRHQFMLNIVWDWNLMPKLKQLTTTYGLENVITFKWRKVAHEVVEEYRKNSVFILPSLAEGQSIVVFEAFAAKIPVVVTEAGDNAQFIKNWENGYIVHSGNSSELAKAIIKMLDVSQEDLDKMWHNWYMLAKEYDRDKVTDRVYHEYKKLLA